MNKEVLKEDIEDLKKLISKYIKENKYDKASECQKEIERIKALLRGEQNGL